MPAPPHAAPRDRHSVAAIATGLVLAAVATGLLYRSSVPPAIAQPAARAVRCGWPGVHWVGRRELVTGVIVNRDRSSREILVRVVMHFADGSSALVTDGSDLRGFEPVPAGSAVAWRLGLATPVPQAAARGPVTGCTVAATAWVFVHEPGD
jgi:hypothetical protein